MADADATVTGAGRRASACRPDPCARPIEVSARSTPGMLVRVPFGRREVAGLTLVDGRQRTTSPTSCGRSPRSATRCRRSAPIGARWSSSRRATTSAASARSRSSVLPPELRRLGARRGRRPRSGACKARYATAAGRRDAARRGTRADRATRPRRPGAIAAADGSDAPAHDAAARRDRQRQDRGLPARRRPGARGRAPGPGAGARDQPDAAARWTASTRASPAGASSRCTAG